MKQALCPHCGANPKIGLWQKTGLGPERSAACSSCGKQLGISLAWIVVFLLATSWLPILLFFIAMILSGSLSSGRVLSGVAAFGALAIGALVQAALFHRLVPFATRGA